MRWNGPPSRTVSGDGTPGDAVGAHVDAELQAAAVDGLRRPERVVQQLRRVRARAAVARAAAGGERRRPPRHSSARSGSRSGRRIGGVQAGLRPASGTDRSIGIVLRHPVALPALTLLALALPGAAQASAPDVLVLDRARASRRAAGPRSCRPPAATELPPPRRARRRATTTRPAARGRAAVVRATVPSRLRALARAGKLSEADAQGLRGRVRRRAAHREAPQGRRPRRARVRAAQRRGPGRRRPADGLAREGRADDRQAQRAVVGRERPARLRAAHAFDGSRLVWQSYPGQGIQIQWLGTFGRMNQLFLAKGYDTELAAMAREIESYAVQPRRRDRLGVPVRLRRRTPAVGQRPRPGHRHPGARRAPRSGSRTRTGSTSRAARSGSSARRRRRACA